MENYPAAESDVPPAAEDASPHPESTPADSPEPITPVVEPEASLSGAVSEALPEPLAERTTEVAPASSASESEQPEVAAESSDADVQDHGEETGPQAERKVEASSEGESQDALFSLAEQALLGRLSPVDEERAGVLLREAMLDGRAGVARAIETLPKLPWVIGVNAVTAAWGEMKPVFRTQLLAGLAKADSDAAKRMRLSLARGLFKVDVPVALKIATGVAKEMRDKETGALSGKHAQIFANVFIGRAKPWISQLPLADLKPADADILIHCALLAAFNLPHAPVTQLGVLKWAAQSGRLAKLHQSVVDAAAKSLARWSAKWQGALRKEVPELPESLASLLKAGPAQTDSADLSSQPGRREQKRGEGDSGRRRPASMEPDADAEEAEVTDQIKPVDGEEPDAEPAEAARDEELIEDEAKGAETGPAPVSRDSRSRPVYESKTVPRKPQAGQEPRHSQEPRQQDQRQQPQPRQQDGSQQGGGKVGGLRDANIPDLLRAVDAQFQSLRGELTKAESKLRQRDEDLRRAQKRTPERASVPIIDGEPTPDELARLNRQLENRNAELQTRIEELLADSEARAVSVGAVTDQPVADRDAQLRTLLALKLQEDFEDFLALEQESHDVVVQQHYRTVLRHVFEVLTKEGVAFAEVAPLP